MAIDFNPERLIEEIENRPQLWDTTCDEYSDRELRKKIWEEIVDIFTEGEEITLEERDELGHALRKKWDNIRACFTREINRQKILKNGGNVGSRKSEYIYYKQLKFLKSVVNPRKETGEPLEAEYSGYGRRLKRVKKESDSEDDSNTSTAYTTSHIMEEEQVMSISEQDEDNLFLMSLLTTLKKVPEDQKMATKIKIMTVLDEATQINYT